MSGRRDPTMWRRLAEALAEGKGKAAAARAAGCSRRMVYKLLEHPDFQRLLDSLDGDAAQTPEELRQAGLAVLLELAQDAACPERERVAAAKALVQLAPQPSRAAAQEAAPAQTHPVPTLTPEQVAAALRVRRSS